MSKITASLSSKVDQRGKSEILLRFVGGRDHIFRLHSGLYIDPSRWKDGGVAVPRLVTQEQRELKALRARLDELSDYLVDEFAGAAKEDVDRKWMQDAVERFLHPDRRGEKSFFALLDEFCRVKDVSEARKRKYEVVVRSLRRFEKYRGRPLTVEGMDVRTLEAYAAFLADEHDIARDGRWKHIYDGEQDLPQRRGKNSLHEYYRVLRTFYNWMVGAGITEHNPFLSYRLSSPVYGTPFFLTLEELDTIYHADFGARFALAVQRDIFVFQCLVGCRVGDLIRLTADNIRDGVLVYVPRKTKDGHPVTVRVPLNDRAREIVDAYAGGKKLLPFISSQNYNEAIKDICRLAGITRPVTVLDQVTREGVQRPLNEVASSHIARRTFIGNLYRIVKDPNIIASMSGHIEGSKAFARYRNIDDDIKAELVRSLEKGEK